MPSEESGTAGNNVLSRVPNPPLNSGDPRPGPKAGGNVPLAAWVFAGVLLASFAFPLFRLSSFALHDELFSYILLVPFVSIYLVWTDRSQITWQKSPLRPWALAPLFGAFAALAFYYNLAPDQAQQDTLAAVTLSLVLFVIAGGIYFLSRPALRVAGFPLLFLLFMIPFPSVVERSVETFLQTGSAPPSYWLFKLAGTPVFKQDMVFQLPNMTLQIAPECSGIRSTLVLFMTSLVAAHLFLKSPWRKLILVAVVVPLALVRNGFRIFTIGELCVHVGPHMIDSPIHHRGGPIFFALSLIPFSLLLLYLVKKDRRAQPPTNVSPSN